MTRRVLKNKESFSSSKATSSSGRGLGKIVNGRNIDTDGIEWVKKDEIVGNRVISGKIYGTKAPKGKFLGSGSSNKRFMKVRAGVLTNLPPKALATILSFDMSSYRKYMSV